MPSGGLNLTTLSHVASKKIMQKMVAGSRNSILPPGGEYRDSGMEPGDTNMEIQTLIPNYNYGQISPGSVDIPAVSFQMNSANVPIRYYKTSFREEEIALAQLARNNIALSAFIGLCMDALNKAKIDTLLLGDRSSINAGLLNNASVNAFALPADSLGATTIVSYDPFELAQILLYFINVVLPAQDNDVSVATHIIIPFDLYNYLRGTIVSWISAGGTPLNKTILTLIEEQATIAHQTSGGKSTKISICPTAYGKGSGAAGTDRIIIAQAYDVFIAQETDMDKLYDNYKKGISEMDISYLQGLAMPFTFSMNPIVNGVQSGWAIEGFTAGYIAKYKRVAYLDYTFGTLTLFGVNSGGNGSTFSNTGEKSLEEFLAESDNIAPKPNETEEQILARKEIEDAKLEKAKIAKEKRMKIKPNAKKGGQNDNAVDVK